ncbi:MAG: hypothetical protein JWP31_405 [Aeromicrobium sp.]|nr:hypothetical protein [Aeromicrobium sp.]
MRARARIAVSAATVPLLLAGAMVALPRGADGAADPTAVVRARCGPGSTPETGLQGQVPRADRVSGRSTKGYACNLRIEGQYQGVGSSWVSPSAATCSYTSTAVGLPGLLSTSTRGVHVVDASKPRSPTLSTRLTSPAMVSGTWESLKVNPRRKLLGAVSGGGVVGSLFFDVYDIGTDCSRPRLLNGVRGSRLTLPTNLLGHEGEWAPDGRTYWASGLLAGSLTAIDTSDPAKPRLLWTGSAGLPVNHGLSFSPDGNRMYLSTAFPAGLTILDISDFRRRVPHPRMRTISSTTWNVAGISQHSIPVSVRGVPHLIVADEFASEGVRIFSLANERKPRLVRHLRLEIQRPAHVAARRADTAGNGLFGYEAHYCSVDRRIDPTALACGYTQSGVRVFDIRSLSRPREIAYFNPPAQVGKRSRLGGSEHAVGLLASTAPPASDLPNLNLGDPTKHALLSNLSADFCTSPPRFVGPDRLWVTCQDNGFLALRFTNRAYPQR